MEKSFWGPSAWCMIHTTATVYSKENKHSFINFISSLPFLLPCDVCRTHLQENLKMMPLTDKYLASSDSLFLWSYLLHDTVNKQLGKQSPMYNIVYNNYYANKNNNAFWGPCYWRAIHSFAANFKPQPDIIQAFKNFIYSLAGIIPCIHCRKNYTLYLTQIPLNDSYFKDAHTLFLWSYLLHDRVNRALGKNSPPFEMIKAEYFNVNVCNSCG